MEMLVFVTGLLLCMVLSAAITMYVAIRIKKYQLLMIVLVATVTMTSSCLIYNNVIQEYFIGKRVTTEQICTDVQVLELYWK